MLGKFLFIGLWLAAILLIASAQRVSRKAAPMRVRKPRR